MTESLSPAGYEQTKAKLTELEECVDRLSRRNDLSDRHRIEAARSYEQMIAQHRREIKLYEALHPENAIGR